MYAGCVAGVIIIFSSLSDICHTTCTNGRLLKVNELTLKFHY